MTIEIMIGPMHGTGDPPNIAVTFKSGSTTLMRVEMTPEAFALAITGRLVHGEVTRASAKGLNALMSLDTSRDYTNWKPDPDAGSIEIIPPGPYIDPRRRS